MNSAGTTSATTPRNTHGHPTLSAMRPAMNGPTSDGTTQAAANPANMPGCRRGGMILATITYSATVSPPPPRPCTSRPATSCHISTAVPAMTSPPANRATEV